MLLILIILTFLLGFTACVLAMVSMSSAVPTVGEQMSEKVVANVSFFEMKR